MSADLQYPIGRYAYTRAFTPGEREQHILRIETLPDRLEAVVSAMAPALLDAPYRPGGWTGRQVIHHLPDSHMNAFVRFKLALTEDTPTIRPYREERWAELHDSVATETRTSLLLLRALHERWVVLLRSLGDADFARSVVHPEHNRTIPLDEMLGAYAWHGDHHLAHLRLLTERG